MKRNPCLLLPFFLLFFAGIGCNISYQSQTLAYRSYRVSDSIQQDLAVENLLKPYGDEVNRTMNNSIGYVETTLEKKQPEGTLGNFMVDAFLEMASEKYQSKVDVAIMNVGGIRLTQLPAGNVTNGKIFELMPFDNLLLLQKIKGSALQQFLDHTAARGGWPLAGIKMQIKDKKAIDVWVGGKPLDPEAIYTIANSDFLANGGEDLAMFRNIPQITKGYLMRDAIIDYIMKLKSQGKNISSKIENRVSLAN